MILAMDTSTHVGSVAIVEKTRVVASRYFDIGMQHSKRLFAEIEQLCQLAVSQLRCVFRIEVVEHGLSFPVKPFQQRCR